MPAKTSTLRQSRRFVMLLGALRGASPSRGWQRAAAGLLGVHPSRVTNLVSGRDSIVGIATVERARETLALGSYFEIDDDAAALSIAAKAARGWRERFTGLSAPPPTLDEFAAMRALDSMNSEQRARVCAWLVARCAEETK